MKIKKIIIFVVIFILAVSIMSATVNAAINPNNYKPNDLTTDDYSEVFSRVGTILNAITIVGVVVSVISVMVLGIKYMMGSVEEKAEYKKTMVPVLVGMILLFCTSTIVSIIWGVVEKAQQNEKTTLVKPGTKDEIKYDGFTPELY